MPVYGREPLWGVGQDRPLEYRDRVSLQVRVRDKKSTSEEKHGTARAIELLELARKQLETVRVANSPSLPPDVNVREVRFIEITSGPSLLYLEADSIVFELSLLVRWS